jgi:hypothetical protein
MISYRTEIRNSWVQAAPSARGLGDLLGLASPVSLRDLIDRLHVVESIHVASDIHTNDSAPINGRVEFELKSDGSYAFSGHMRATGMPSYHYGLQGWVKTADGTVIAAQRVGNVYGWDTPGPVQNNWSQPGNNIAIQQHWESLRADAHLGFTMDANIAGVLGTVWDVLTFALKGIAANIVLGQVGLVVLIGTELADLGVKVGTPDILGGVLVAGGTLVILGPFGLIPAVVAGVATAELIDVRHRSMTEEERTFADRVFNGKVDFDRVTLTNMSQEGRKFTIPSIDDSILVNLDDAFDQPTMFQSLTVPDYVQKGSVFIHELTHAWQITNKSFVGMICGMSQNYSYHAGPRDTDRTTNLGWENRPWGEFNNEQQAHIVDDWYGAHWNDLDGAEATRDPAFHFIRDNIRRGRV